MATKNFDFDPEYYDLQVDWKKRFEKEKDFYDGIFSRAKISSVLDIGCGTGHHPEFFAGYADRVVAVDPDKEMIEYAGKNVIKSPKVSIYRAGFEELESIPEGKFDLITSLGNTIAILGDKRKIKQALKSIRSRLSENGIVLLQFLNFSSKIIDENNYYQPKVFKKDGNTFVFVKHFQYGRQKTRVDFIITELENNKVKDFYVNSSYLATLKVSAFRSMAKNSGFKNIELLGTGGKVAFEPKKHISLYALMSGKEK